MEDLSRTVHHLQLEIRALREGLERTARHAHDVDPSTGHLAEFDRCPHPLCRQARALLLESPQAPTTAPEDARPPLTPNRRRAREEVPMDEEPAMDEGLGGTEGIDRSGDDELEPSFIPLDRRQAPPPRKPATEPIEAPAPAAAESKPAQTIPPEVPRPAEPPRQAEPPRPPIATPPPSTSPPPSRFGGPSPRTGEEPPIPSQLFDQPPRREQGTRIDRPPEAPREPVDRRPQEPARPVERRPQGPTEMPRPPQEPTEAVRRPPEPAEVPPQRTPAAAASGAQGRPTRSEERHPTETPKPPDRRPLDTTRPPDRRPEAPGASAPGRQPQPISDAHQDAERDPNIADAAADAIDRLARALFGPKRPRR